MTDISFTEFTKDFDIDQNSELIISAIAYLEFIEKKETSSRSEIANILKTTKYCKKSTINNLTQSIERLIKRKRIKQSRSKEYYLSEIEKTKIAEKFHINIQKTDTENTNTNVPNVDTELATYIKKIKNKQAQSFIKDAEACYKHELHRPAILMSWMGAIRILQQNVIDKKFLGDFNQEGSRRVEESNKKKEKHGEPTEEWKRIRQLNGFTKISEDEFLEIICGIDMIDVAVKNKLKDCLKSRNNCCHPNQLDVDNSESKTHLIALIKNVFSNPDLDL